MSTQFNIPERWREGMRNREAIMCLADKASGEMESKWYQGALAYHGLTGDDDFIGNPADEIVDEAYDLVRYGSRAKMAIAFWETLAREAVELLVRYESAPDDVFEALLTNFIMMHGIEVRNPNCICETRDRIVGNAFCPVNHEQEGES